MLLSNQKTIEEYAVEMLALRDATAHEVLTDYNKYYKSVTIQAVYKALRKLDADQAIVKHKEVYSLNSVWRTKVVELLQTKSPLPRLLEGDSIQYSFRTFEQLDEYWKHVYRGSSLQGETVYFFCAHQFWFFLPGRHESEAEMYRQFEKDKRRVLFLIGDDSRPDKEMKKILSTKNVLVHTDSRHSFSMSDSISVENDLIIRSRLSPHVAKSIDTVFKMNLSIKETIILLKPIFSKRTPLKISIERNAKKAEKIRRQIGKYFE